MPGISLDEAIELPWGLGKVLDAVADDLAIFNAWGDEDWINDGAAVRVSLVAFAATVPEGGAWLNGHHVGRINPDLTATATTENSLDLTKAARLLQNAGCSFIGGMKKGQFDVAGDVARSWLPLPNPNGKSNSHVLFPWVNGLDITRRPSDTWIVDFGLDMPEDDASLFEQPFAHVLAAVKPARDRVSNANERRKWWLHARASLQLHVTVDTGCSHGLLRQSFATASWLFPPAPMTPLSASCIHASTNSGRCDFAPFLA
jgi:hypothetical protein